MMLNIFDKKAVLIDSSGEYFGSKSMLEKIESIMTGKINHVLNEREVLEGYYYSRENGIMKMESCMFGNDFSLISNKNAIINQNIYDILYVFSMFGKLDVSSIDYKLYETYSRLGLITQEEIDESIDLYNQNESKKI